MGYRYTGKGCSVLESSMTILPLPQLQRRRLHLPGLHRPALESPAGCFVGAHHLGHHALQRLCNRYGVSDPEATHPG